MVEIPLVLISCGSFNPVTRMHLRMFKIAKDYLDELETFKVIKGIISPVNDIYSTKFGKKQLIPSHHRVKMVDLAIKDSNMKWIQVDDWEAKQTSWMTTWSVLKHHYDELNSSKLSNMDKKIQVKMLAGADLIESMLLPIWEEKDIVNILQMFGIIIIPRAGWDAEEIIKKNPFISKYLNLISITKEWQGDTCSSTEARQLISKKIRPDNLLYESVIDYIFKNNLYL